MDQKNDVRIDVVGSVDSFKAVPGEVERELDKMKSSAQQAGQALGDLANGALNDAVGGVSDLTGVSERAVVSLAALGGGFVAATVGVLAFAAAAKQGHEEQLAMDHALAVSGDYAGMTRDQMEKLAKAVSEAGTVTVGVSKTIVTELVASGRIAGSAIAEIAGLAENYANVTGQKVDTIAPKLVALFADPAKGAAQLNEQMHFLTNAQLEYIDTLAESGRLGEAQLELSDRLKVALPEHAQELGLLQTAWVGLGKAASKAWDFMLGIGKEDTLEQKLRAAQEAAANSSDWWRKFRDYDGKVAVYQAAVDKQEADAEAKAAAARLQQREAQGEAMLAQYSKTAKKMALAKKMAEADALLPDGSGKDEVLAALREQIINLDREKAGPKAKEDPAIKARIRDLRDQAAEELKAMQAADKAAAALAAQRVKADDLLASYGRQDAQLVQRIARQAQLASMSEKERTVAEAVYQAEDLSARRQEQIIKQIGDETERTRALNLEKAQLASQIEAVTAAAAKSYEAQRTFSFGWDKALQTYQDQATNAAATAQGAFQTMTSVVEDSLVSFATNTKYTFRDMAQSILRSLAQVAAKQAAMGLMQLGTSLASSAWSSYSASQTYGTNFGSQQTSMLAQQDAAFGGQRAAGGPVDAGMTYLVGEKGPELLRMGSSGGTVIPNEAMGGGVSVQQIFQISGSGSSSQTSGGDGSSSMRQFADLMAGVAKRVIVDEMRSGGLLEKARAA